MHTQSAVETCRTLQLATNDDLALIIEHWTVQDCFFNRHSLEDFCLVDRTG